MTNSMIPYSFIPGTKAKAGEVNANFIALANEITQNKSIANENILDIKEILKDKVNKTELNNNFTVTTAETDLNDYKTTGTFIFSSLYTPNNIPKDTAGTLFVTGVEDSVIKQIWFCDGTNNEIFTRNCQNGIWTPWNSITGDVNFNIAVNSGYIRLPNKLLLQWGKESANPNVVYPIAFSTFACPVVVKNGCGTEFTRSDFGITAQSLTGFSIVTAGRYQSLNWIAIGY